MSEGAPCAEAQKVVVVQYMLNNLLSSWTIYVGNKSRWGYGSSPWRIWDSAEGQMYSVWYKLRTQVATGWRVRDRPSQVKLVTKGNSGAVLLSQASVVPSREGWSHWRVSYFCLQHHNTQALIHHSSSSPSLWFHSFSEMFIAIHENKCLENAELTYLASRRYAMYFAY